MIVTVNKNSSILAGNSYSFIKPITVLVGGNGSGKTSLLKAIAISIDPSELELNTNRALSSKDISIVDGPEKISYFFAENNLKHKAYLGDDMLDQIMAMKSSSGEATFAQVLNIIQDKFVILDEPDQSLDISNNYGLSLLLKVIAAKRDSQIIVTVHSAQVLNALDGLSSDLIDIINVETGMNISAEEYIKLEKEKIRIKFKGQFC